ncbi:hypothetical protein [Parasphingopyxis sp.]|uniref:hypothetical protein n=1 Tax=Parasphingopyxis sp. TaxID=1920299 RepID=UPI002616BB71|nr:hypothetical protein [Parasphingopyxis sp.]
MKVSRMGVHAMAAAALLLSAGAFAQRPPPPPLPDMPATPQYPSTPYPNCRNDYRNYSEAFARAEATNRCTRRIDAYHNQVMAPFVRTMLRHQERITELYESQVMNDFDYTQEQADGFYAQIMQEHADSNPDGRHMARYQEMIRRYRDDRAFLRRTFCQNAGTC